MAKRIYIDMDGTLCRFHDAEHKYIEQMWEKGFYANLQPFEEFVKAISENINEITHISFDHDLGGDVQESFRFDQGFSKRKARKAKQLLELPTGYDCAKWMKDFYRSKDKQHPVMFVHSMNPVGTQNIINLFK